MSVPPAHDRKRDLLFELSRDQGGFFTTQQAGDIGITTPYLNFYLRAGHILRAGRGVYRLARFPSGDQEDLIPLWLATARDGVFSHETALALHQLSDALPSRVHISLPPSWRRRKLPDGIERHYTGLAATEVWWVGAVPVTAPLRTLEDCAVAHVAPELVRQALRQAQARGMLREAEAAAFKERHGAAYLLDPDRVQDRP